MPKSERPKKRRIKLVGGGYRWSREFNGVKGGSVKSMKRGLRKTIKDRDLTPAKRRAAKEALRNMLKAKNTRSSGEQY